MRNRSVAIGCVGLIALGVITGGCSNSNQSSAQAVSDYKKKAMGGPVPTSALNQSAQVQAGLAAAAAASRKSKAQ